MSNRQFNEQLLTDILFRRDESWDRRSIYQPAFARVYSLLRKNCIEWIPFEPGCTIAEIGCNYGDFSDILIAKASYCYIYNPSEIGAEIIRERYKSKSFTVSSGELDTFLEMYCERADYVVIHDLPFLFSDKKAFSQVLERLKGKKKKIIILFDEKESYRLHNNKFIKFYELNKIKQKYKNLEFSFKEALLFLKEIGFNQNVFYCAAPNNTFPLTITSITDVAGGEKSFTVLIDEDGTFMLSCIPPCIHYSNERAERYSTKTLLYEDRVEKYALNKFSQTFLNQMCENHALLENIYKNSNLSICGCRKVDSHFVFDYITGVSLENKLDNYRISDDLDGFLSLINDYGKTIRGTAEAGYFSRTFSFERYFGGVFGLDELKTAAITNVDLNFDNILVDKTGKWTVIDYEWTFHFPIPVDFVLYRAVFYYFHRSLFGNKYVLWEEKSYETLGIDEKYFETFEQMERSFQKEVDSGIVPTRNY